MGLEEVPHRTCGINILSFMTDNKLGQVAAAGPGVTAAGNGVEMNIRTAAGVCNTAYLASSR